VVRVRLADDDRGRVPFALVGALLLVASASVATTVSQPQPEPGPPDAAVASDHAVSSARTAVRSAVATALERGAADPVVTPADSPYGRVLNDSTPYRDALRVRAYVRVQRALQATTVRVGDATAAAGTAPVATPSDLRAGKRDVSLVGHGNGTVTATVRNVSVVVRVDGTVVDTETHDVAVTVASPALVLHDRVERYDDRLDRGVVDGHGFGRQFGARLYGVSWLRGYAQYGGAPVGNVVSTRHVALAANGAALATQRSVFGRADAAASRAHRRALVRVGIRDVTQQYSRPGIDAERYLDAVLGSHPGGSFSHASPGAPAIPSGSAGPGAELDVSVDATADDAFADFLAGTDGASLDGVLAGTYHVRLETAARVQSLDPAGTPSPERPGENWTHVETTMRTETTVENGTAAVPSTDGEAVLAASRTRVVAVTRTSRARWTRGNETRTTTDATVERVRVGIAVLAEHAPASSVARRVPSAFHERGSVDPNLVDVAEDADGVFETYGGVDAIAARVATDGTDAVARGPDGRARPSTLQVRGTTTNRTRAVVYRDVAALRDEVRDLSVSVERGSVLGGDPPTARLLAAVRERRDSLAPASTTYDSVASAASVAAQHAYLDHVERRLEARVEADRAVGSRARRLVQRTLSDATDRAVGSLADVQTAIRDTDSTPPPAVENHLVGGVDVAVAGSPSYLVVDSIDAERVRSVERDGSVHALAARNVNVFTVPTDDATNRVVDAVMPENNGTSLRDAVRQLQRANAVADADRTDALTRKHHRLRRAVSRSVARTRGRVASTLAARTTLDADAATVAVQSAFETYPSTRARADAIVNGDVTARIVDAAAARARDPSDRFRDATRTHVAATLRDARASSEIRPPDDGVAALRTALGEHATQVTGDATENVLGGGENGTDAPFLGLPLAPVPGFWYATANVWVVDVRGTYPTFAVRARNATTGRLGTTTYVRDGAGVSMDVDGDGVADRLGYADRVTARATVPLTVVVPPGKRGVGDRNLVQFESSPGWPCPVSSRQPGAVDAAVANESKANRSADDGTDPTDGLDSAGCEDALYADRLGAGMFHDQRHDVDGLSVADLRAEYVDDLATVVAESGIDAIVDATDLDRPAVEAIADGALPAEFMLTDAAAVLSVRDGVADPDTVVEIAADHLLLGMTTGVMDVDAVASELEIDLDAKEVQQKIERRAPMTFDEFVHVQHVIASRQR